MSSTARPVVIATRIYPPEVAAAAFRLQLLAKALSGAGIAVHVLTSRPPAVAGPAQSDPGVTVSRWPVLRDGSGAVRGNLQYLSFDIPLALRLLTHRRPRLVVSEPPPTTGLAVMLVCMIRRINYVYYAADVWSEAAGAAGAGRATVRLLRFAERLVASSATRVLTVSPGVKDSLTALGVPESGIQVVANGIDIEVFHPAGPHTDERHPFAAYTGTMSEWQGAEVFIEGFARIAARHPRARLVFVGQGSAEVALRALAQRLVPGRVEFRGIVGPHQAAALLRGAAVAMVSIKPGLGYDFARPTKIYAATGCGTPVVFAGRGAGAELVRSHALGQAVDHDAAGVADALDVAFATAPNQDERRRLAEWTARHASLAGSLRAVVDDVLAGTL